MFITCWLALLLMSPVCGTDAYLDHEYGAVMEKPKEK